MSSHANPDLLGVPGYQAPRSFRPLVRDDSLPHQIRIVGQSMIAVSCVCLLKVQPNNPAGFAEAFPIVSAVEALAWYRTHLAETTRTGEECRKMPSDVKEVTSDHNPDR